MCYNDNEILCRNIINLSISVDMLLLEDGLFLNESNLITLCYEITFNITFGDTIWDRNCYYSGYDLAPDHDSISDIIRPGFEICQWIPR